MHSHLKSLPLAWLNLSSLWRRPNRYTIVSFIIIIIIIIIIFIFGSKAKSFNN